MSNNWFSFKEKQNCNYWFGVKGIVAVAYFSKMIYSIALERVSKFIYKRSCALKCAIPSSTTINKNLISVCNQYFTFKVLNCQHQFPASLAGLLLWVGDRCAEIESAAWSSLPWPPVLSNWLRQHHVVCGVVRWQRLGSSDGVQLFPFTPYWNNF